MKEQTHLKEWHISNTLIQIIPKYIELFQAMRILDLPKNQISRLPAEIGMFLSWNLQAQVTRRTLPSPAPGRRWAGLFHVSPEMLVHSVPSRR